MTNHFFTILYEDNHLIIVNKKGGLLVQGDRTGDASLVDLVKDYLKKKYQKPGNIFCGVIHRIDRPVSGLVVLAKTSKALERMNALFREKKIKKTYWAIIKNKPAEEEKTLIHWLEKDTSKNKVKLYTKAAHKNLLNVELHYKLIRQVDHFFLLEVYPLTGRPHQIRAQLAFMGCPIRGDIKYGYPTANTDQCINLHAQHIEFIHPVQKTILSCSAPIPSQPTWKGFEFLN